MIKHEFDMDSTFVESEGGIFEVTLDGDIVFTNDDRRGFVPEPQEVLDLLHTRLE